MFCEKEILKQDANLGRPITIPGMGVAHSYCAEVDLTSRRVYGSIALAELPMTDLYELRELVLMEINAREGHGEDEVDLF